MKGQPAATSPRRFAYAVLIGIGCVIGFMVGLPMLVWLTGDVGWFIGVVLLLGLGGWAAWHARRHDMQQRQAAPLAQQPANVIGMFQTILSDERQSWVLFRHGTVVVLTEPQSAVSELAVAFLRSHGPVIVGCESGDFGAYELIKYPGWIVTSHREEMMTYVGSDELGGKPETVLSVGLLGRGKRGLDAAELEVIHVEDKRPAGGSAANSP